jgi:hypothetical protein
MSITFTIAEGVNCDITQTPITFEISGVQVNSGQLVPVVTGNALKYLRANAAATALEYVSVPAGTGDMTIAVYDTNDDGSVNMADILKEITPPVTSTSTGIKGQIAADDDYIYYCVATNLWKRALLMGGSW